jgi:hypothetical protein
MVPLVMPVSVAGTLPMKVPPNNATVAAGAGKRAWTRGQSALKANRTRDDPRPEALEALEPTRGRAEQRGVADEQDAGEDAASGSNLG